MNRINYEMKLNAFLFGDIDQLPDQKDWTANQEKDKLQEKNKDTNEQENNVEARRKKYILHRAHVIVYKYETQKDLLHKRQLVAISLLSVILCGFLVSVFFMEVNYYYFLYWCTLLIIGVLCGLWIWWLRKKTLRIEIIIKKIYNITLQYQCDTGKYCTLTENEKISLYAKELEELV